MKKTIAAAMTAMMLTGAMMTTAFAAAQGEITICSREDGSGTRGAFIELFGVEEKDADGNKVDNTTEAAKITNSTSVMLSTIEGDVNAIGYISLGSLNDSVTAVKLMVLRQQQRTSFQENIRSFVHLTLQQWKKSVKQHRISSILL